MLRRVLSEQRRFLVPLAILLAIDVVVYAGVVYPLAERVSEASSRAAAADAARRRAEQELKAIKDVAAGKDRAEAELKTFYQQVLPANLSAADRATYLPVAQLARKTNLRITRRQGSAEVLRDSSLGRWRNDLTLEGSYENIRRFIYELETGPNFLVIDELSIAPGRDENTLILTLGLSTYYRAADNAS